MPIVTCPCEEMAPMKQVQRDGIEIDVCTKCRGVWLDRGELEKLLSVVRAPDDDLPPRAAPPQRHASDYDARRDYDRDKYRDDDDYRRKKKGRFDIFDIFD